MSVCDLPGITTVCSAAGDGAATVLAAGFEWLASGVAGVAAVLIESVWMVFETTTFVDVSAEQFRSVYAIVFGIAVFVMLAFFLLQVIAGMVRREPAALSRAVLGLAKSVLGSFIVLALVAASLEITDRLCIGIVHATGTTMSEMGDRLNLLTASLLMTTAGGPGVAILLTLFVGGLAAGAAFILWLSLLVRKALLLIAVVFAPLALAGATWDATRGWVGRWASFVVALIVSKVVIVVVFLLATAQVASPIDSDLQSLADPLAGIVLLLVAGFAPYLTYKAISFMGFDMYHAMSAEQEAKHALNRPVPVPASLLARSPAKVLDVGGSPGAGASRGGGRPPAAGGGTVTTSAPPGPASTGSGGAGTAPAATGGTRAAAGGAGASGAAAGAGAAAAGVGLAVAGAAIAHRAVTAGPKAGAAVAGAVEQQQGPTITQSAPHSGGSR
ncbi:conjugal transfer protein TrbL [Georgenia yuyongxinii]|uniref:Conjugal transfer protein TrbL n=1 Tax=Georgenia yuyongxinii TaxID=2589797 RepID=A0A552WX57_9MICO|nr:conjugal transfer protein TrbL [Georgenia yuyongxinii]TRW47418.1 conjugal transfer protein TrbL [Georgenia yuyongxinii]